MTSFCLAGSGSVGPSQISLTPSSLRGLLGPLAAGDEVGVPLALGHHGHGDRRAAVGSGGLATVGVAGSRPMRRSLWSDWTRKTLPAAMISAAGQDRRRRSRRLASSSRSSPPRSCWLANGSAAGSRSGGRARSQPGASVRSRRRPARPGGRPAAGRSEARRSRSRPSSVPGMLPRPPKIDVPPSTTAVIAGSS